MNITPDGVIQFADVYELTYELFNDLDLEVKADGLVYDARACSILAFNGTNLKANIDPYNIHYAGNGEMMCDILTNIKLITRLFGWDLKRKIDSKQIPFRSYYPTEVVGDDEIKRTNLTIKLDDVNFINTKFYHNKCLKFIEMMFILNGDNVDLYNFDVIEEEHKN